MNFTKNYATKKTEIFKKLAKFDKIIQRMNPVFSAINTYHLGVLFLIFPRAAKPGAPWGGHVPE